MRNKKLSQMARISLVVLLCLSGMTMVKAQLVHPLYYQAAQKTSGPGIAATNAILVDFESGLGTWGVQSASRGEVVSLSVAKRSDGDPVRFGQQAMKMNFDLTAAQKAQTLGCYANPNGSTAAFKIPAGTEDRRFGFWIYVTPEFQQAKFWARIMFSSTAAGGAVSGEQVAGFNELYSSDMRLGWQYYNLTLSSASVNNGLNTKELRPFASATTSYALFRFMQVSSATNQLPLVKGYCIIDNLRFSIGAEDNAYPTISAITGNGTNLRSTPTFNKTGNVELKFTYTDSGGSGINAASAIFAVNGVIYKQGDTGFTADGTSATLNRSFRNGTHSVQCYIEDNFGNITAETVTFKVDDPSFVATNIWLEPAADAFVGREFAMNIVTDKAEDVKALDVNFQWDMLASVAGTGALELASGVTGNYTYTPQGEGGKLNVKLQNDNTSSSGKKTLATVKITISNKVFYEQIFRCTPGLATATYGEGDMESFSFFNEFSREIMPNLSFSVINLIAGSPGELSVTDLATGQLLAGATVRLGTNSGVTAANGIASGITIPSGQFDIVATKDGRYSYTVTTKALVPFLTVNPEGIRSGTNADNATSKTITWLSIPSALPAKMRLAKQADGEGAFVEYTGVTQSLNYPASTNVAKGNKVIVTGLEPGTTYIYKVGDGTNWSPTRTFTTTKATDKFSFATFGDHQLTSAGDLGMLLAAGNTLGAIEPKPFFLLNVGDNPDTDDNYGHLQQYNSLMDQRPGMANINLVATYGNHEYMGGPNNIKFLNGAQSAAASPSYNVNRVGTGSSYSIYGNLIAFALDWEGGGNSQTEQAKWIDEVLTAHPDITWKIVTLHYPIWPSASTPGSQAAFDPIFEKHGVNIVFCGHGHTYRRALVKNKSVVTNLGPSANYTDVNSKDGVLHWELGGIRPSDGASQKWTFAEVDGRKIKFTIRDGNNNVLTNQSFTLYHQDYAELKVNFSTIDANGTIAAKVNDIAIADGANVQKGKDIVFTATPDDGYAVKEWRVNGTPVEGNTSKTFTLKNLPAASTVTVEFSEAKTYQVNFSVEGSNGTLTATVDGAAITSGNKIEEGKDVVFTATPSEGYIVKEWKLGEDVVVGNTSNTYTLENLRAAATVTVEFEVKPVPINYYEVIFSAVNSEGGTLTAVVGTTGITSGDEVEEGKDVIFTATPNIGYIIKEWKLGEDIVVGNTTNSYTLENLSEKATVTVEFKLETGIETVFAPELKMYPNPFAEELTIAGAKDCALQVMDIVGKLVHTQKIADANETIRLGKLSAGVYFFRFEKDGQTKTVKVLKK